MEQLSKILFETDITMVFEMAGLPLTQEFVELMAHCTRSPLAGIKLYVDAFVPAGAPFTSH